MAEHFEMLLRLSRYGLTICQRGGETRALDWELLDAADRGGRFESDDLQQGRRNVAGVAELIAGARLADALGPVDH